MADDFTIVSSALPPGARVAGFRGVEGISRCYQLEVEVLVGGEEQVDPEDVVGLRAALLITVPDEQAMIFHGLIGSFELLRSVESSVAIPRVNTLYRLSLVPQLWFLGATRHSRVFVKKTVVELVTTVLEAEGIDREDFEFRLKKTYPTEEHICQYQESSLAFVSRWMEREGLYWHFDHSEDRERIIITDDETFAQACPLSIGPIAYFPDTSGESGVGPHFDNLQVQKISTPAALRLDDYDFSRPALDLSSRVSVVKGTTGEVAGYGHRYFDPECAKRLAAIRAEELRAQALVYVASGNVLRIRSGYTFAVQRHPIDTLNVSYLAHQVEHWGYTASLAAGWAPLVDHPFDLVYRMRARALPTTVQYRAGLHTPWPRVDGFENAIVDGPQESDYAQLDSHGSYLVEFKFDEGTDINGRASTRIRMMQPHGGGAEGFHFPLRKGTEVLCAFLGGDPDRPVIIGVAPNLVKPSPVVESNQTQNIIQTGGRTYMCIDDQEGSKFASFNCPYVPGMQSELYLGYGRPDGGSQLTKADGPQRAQKGEFMQPITNPNLHLRTTGTGMISSGGPLDVSSMETLQIESDSKIVLYAPQWFRQIGGTVWDHIGSLVFQTFDDAWTLHVADKVEHRFGGAFDQTIHGKVTQSFEDTQDLTVGEAATHQYNNGWFTIVDAVESRHKVHARYVLNVDLDAVVHSKETIYVTGDKKVEISDEMGASIILEANKITLATKGGAATLVLENNTIALNAEAISLNGRTVIDLKGPEIWQIGDSVNSIASGNNVVKGGLVKINCD